MPLSITCPVDGNCETDNRRCGQSRIEHLPLIPPSFRSVACFWRKYKLRRIHPPVAISRLLQLTICRIRETACNFRATIARSDLNELQLYCSLRGDGRRRMKLVFVDGAETSLAERLLSIERRSRRTRRSPSERNLRDRKTIDCDVFTSD